MKKTILIALLFMLQSTDAQLFKANNHTIQKSTGALGNRNQALQVADINGDDFDDLVITSTNNQGLVIYLGGEAGFSELFTTPITEPASLSAIFDVENDGDEDIWLTLMFADDRDLLLLNDGQGNFTQQSVTNGDSYPYYGVYDLLPGDIDNDGDIDLIKTVDEIDESFPYNNTIVAQLFFNDGMGHFQLSETQLNASQFSHLTDFNQDGYLDFITAFNNLQVYYNDQTALFQQSPLELGLNINFFCADSGYDDDMLFEDIDGDGDLDIQLLSKSLGLRRWTNNDDGSFTTSGANQCVSEDDSGNSLINPFDIRPTPRGVFVDVNDDDIKDLWLGYNNNDFNFLKHNSKVAINLSATDGSMADESTNLSDANVLHLSKGRLNNDDQTDIVSLNFEGLTTWLADEQGRYTYKDNETINQSWGWINQSMAADIDNDGTVDLAYLNSQNLYIKYGNGAGAYSAPRKVSDANYNSLLVTDLDNNGLVDFVGLGLSNDGSTLVMSLQNEEGVFSSQEKFIVGYFSAYIPKPISNGDFDGDGDQDLLIIIGPEIFVFQNQGGSIFEEIQVIESQQFNALKYVDINNQNRAAFLVSGVGNFENGTEEFYQEWLWSGEQFDLKRSVTNNRQEYDIVTSDYDGDGDLDILSSSRVDDNHYLLVINETDGFTKSQYAPPGGAVKFIEDLNGDGLLDLVDGNEFIYLNKGNDQYQLNSELSEANIISQLIDLDADGDLDVLTNNMSTYLNQTNHVELSGLWFNPNEDGHGLSLEQLEVDGQSMVLFSWFALHQNQPFWLIGLAPLVNKKAEIELSYTAGTGFGEDFNSQDVVRIPWGMVSIDLAQANLLNVSWQPLDNDFDGGQMQMQRLSVIKSAADQPHVINSCHSGSWYSPDQDGHGLFVQVVEVGGKETMIVLWYHYSENSQYWMVGQGPIRNLEADVLLFSGSGGEFPPNYQVDDNSKVPWGELKFKLKANDKADISWHSELPGFDVGELRLEKLTELDRYRCRK